MDIKKVVIIGSGTMGSGIAAQVANAGIPVSLLDLLSKEGSRNQIAEKAKERILKSSPPLLIEKSKIDYLILLSPGFFLYPLMNSEVVGRKDILLVFVMGFLVFSTKSQKWLTSTSSLIS